MHIERVRSGNRYQDLFLKIKSRCLLFDDSRLLIRCTVLDFDVPFRLLDGCCHTVAMHRHSGSSDRHKLPHIR